ncbi:hypothetical protein TEA_000534 [Camellia sinensis var. sinensis]|uniref:ATP-dependent RNA helicase n=1 Tax=Camellia sinensis var. sinensis TaxID=542762 RepID=A0A4S4D1S9_CAMSN|nr:hypothetical protein TEA_000534 [Camellia sinensis var. sinensis]
MDSEGSASVFNLLQSRWSDVVEMEGGEEAVIDRFKDLPNSLARNLVSKLNQQEVSSGKIRGKSYLSADIPWAAGAQSSRSRQKEVAVRVSPLRHCLTRQTPPSLIIYLVLLLSLFCSSTPRRRSEEFGKTLTLAKKRSISVTSSPSLSSSQFFSDLSLLSDMAGLAPEGSQFDARQYDAKMSDLLGTTYGEEFFTSYDEVYDSFDAMGLQENLLRGIYAYGFEKPSAIQQRGIVPFCKGLDVIQQAQSGTGKTATFCSGILQQLDYGIVECQALVLAPTRELAQQIEKVMRALGDYLHVLQALLQISIHSSLKIKNNTVHIVQKGVVQQLIEMLQSPQAPMRESAFALGGEKRSIYSVVADVAVVFFFFDILFLLLWVAADLAATMAAVALGFAASVASQWLELLHQDTKGHLAGNVLLISEDFTHL